MERLSLVRVAVAFFSDNFAVRNVHAQKKLVVDKQLQPQFGSLLPSHNAR
jgi:hypothetical protein